MGLLNTWDEVVQNHPSIGQIGDLISMPSFGSSAPAAGAASTSIASATPKSSGLFQNIGNVLSGFLSGQKKLDLNKAIQLPTVEMGMDKETKTFAVALVAGAALLFFMMRGKR